MERIAKKHSSLQMNRIELEILYFQSTTVPKQIKCRESPIRLSGKNNELSVARARLERVLNIVQFHIVCDQVAEIELA